MRAKSTKKDAKVSPNELIKQYVEANKANNLKIVRELRTYKESISVLAKQKMPRKLKGDAGAELKNKVEACLNSRAKLRWYLNIMDTNSNNLAALLEVASPEKAKRERINAGEYRAKIMFKLSKLEVKETRAMNRVPASVMADITSEKENRHVRKKK